MSETQKELDEKIQLFERGVKTGIEHRGMSKETEREIGEMRDEWADTKKFVRGVALVVGLALLGYGVWVGTIETRIDDYGSRISNGEKVYDDLRTKVQSAEVSAAEIKTKLTNIELTLIEIKQALKIR